MSTAHRFRMSRAKGWRKPANVLVVARGTPYGNPFRWQDHGHTEAVRLHRAWLVDGEGPDEIRSGARTYRRPYVRGCLLGLGEALDAGWRFGCWCSASQPCHSDTLAEAAATWPGSPCADCTARTSDLDEWYMVHESVWAEACPTQLVRFLCLGCLETRLGRTLTACDFIDIPVNDPDQTWHSDRLADRLGAVVSHPVTRKRVGA